MILDFPVGSVLKNLPASAGAAGDVDEIPGSGRLLVEEMATHSSILAWRISWTEEAGWPQSIGLQGVGNSLVTKQQQG